LDRAIQSEQNALAVVSDGSSDVSAAGPDEFRTTPLWGVGQRLFFLHDGRTNDLLAAIKEHSSPKTATFPASEANAVVSNFERLPPADQQAILDFLRSL
jgi:CxxC motif-containing protein (DUF1111 family)